jgi:hypothetical protein
MNRPVLKGKVEIKEAANERETQKMFELFVAVPMLKYLKACNPPKNMFNFNPYFG